VLGRKLLMASAVTHNAAHTNTHFVVATIYISRL